jgi:hypothetical protein
MKIEVTADKPACWGCFHYSGQFSELVGHPVGGYCEYIRYSGGSGDQFVEADHYCKRFTFVNPKMPTTLAEAISACESWLDGYTDDDCDKEMTVAEMLAEVWDTPEEALYAHFDNADVLDWRITLSAEWHTIRGDGWGAYYGPTPDEHEGRVYVSVYDSNNKIILDEGGSHEDYSGRLAAIVIVDELTVSA